MTVAQATVLAIVEAGQSFLSARPDSEPHCFYCYPLVKASVTLSATCPGVSSSVSISHWAARL